VLEGAELPLRRTLYASHAQEVCGAGLDDTSATCSAVGCTSPTPEQRDLGDNAENDCQRMLSKAGLNYMLKREKILDRCMLRGLTYPACLADPKTQLQLAKAETQKQTLILKKCNGYSRSRTPSAAGPARADLFGYRPQRLHDEPGRHHSGREILRQPELQRRHNDGASCAVDSRILGAPATGRHSGPGKALTWWEHCPNNEPCRARPSATSTA
jgi:hypothetical protein